jgi:transcriptional regulator with XRE-family HTH domain
METQDELLKHIAYVKIGDKLKRIREFKGMKQESVARELGLSTNGYGKIERGESSLSLDRLEKIARALDVSALDILKYDDSIVFNINTMNSSAPNGIVHNYALNEEERRMLVEQIKTLHNLLNSQAALINSLMKNQGAGQI